MKNKNGFLLAEETLKIVIAVICIMFLVYFLTSLYFAKVNEEKLREAEAVLKTSDTGSIKTIIERVESEKGNIDGNSEEKIIYNPEGWYLFGFVEEVKPYSCVNQNCLCICEKVYIDTLFGFIKSKQISKCDEEGTCLQVTNLKEFEKIKIKNPTEILISKINNKIEILEK